MKIIKFFILILIFGLFLGCGGGGDTKTVVNPSPEVQVDGNLSQTPTDNNMNVETNTTESDLSWSNGLYGGKTNKAVITEENVKVFIQASIYMRQIYEMDENLEYIDHYKCPTVEGALDQQTGLGTLEYFLNDCKCYMFRMSNDDVWNKTNAHIKNEYMVFDQALGISGNRITVNDFVVRSPEQNLTMNLKMDYKRHTRYEDGEFQLFAEEYNIAYLVIDDHVTGQKYAFKDLTFYGPLYERPYISGKIYVDDFGYVDYTYNLDGLESHFLSDANEKEYKFEAFKSDYFYYPLGYEVPDFEKKYFLYGSQLFETQKPFFRYFSLPYWIYTDQDFSFEYENYIEGVDVTIQWYVNDQELYQGALSTLSHTHFKKGDKVTLKLYATANGEEVVQVINKVVKNKSPEIKYNSEYGYGYPVRVREKIVTLDLESLFEISDADGDKLSYLVQKSQNYDGVFGVEVVESTQTTLNPTINLLTLDKQVSLHLQVSDGEDYNTSIYFNLEYKPYYFDHKVAQNVVDYSLYLDEIKVADMNGDKRKDIVSTLYGVQSYPKVLILFQNTEGEYAQQQLVEVEEGYNNFSVKQVYTSDFNHDGRMDLVLKLDNKVILLTQKEDGTFNTPTLIYASLHDISDVEVRDLDSDGFADLIITSMRQENIELFYGQSDGLFRHTTLDESTYMMEINELLILDFNQDEKLDIVLLSNSGFTVFTQNDEGGFIQKSKVLSFDKELNASLIADVNQDSYPDIIYLFDKDYSSKETYVVLGDEESSFEDTLEIVLNHSYARDFSSVHLFGKSSDSLIGFDEWEEYFTIYSIVDGEWQQERGDFFKKHNQYLNSYTKYNKVNFDNDGLTDMIFNDHHGFQILYTKF